jgi:membrane dipeptidase
MRVADLHCDLLGYLSNGNHRTVFDPESQSSVPFLKEGNVTVQIFPIFTPASSLEGEKQFELYSKLCQTAPDFFGSVLTPRLAIENASVFCSEDEPLEQALKRLESWWKKHPIVYISLTWNGENRFGGGADTAVGLKEDGKTLLHWMSQKKIAVDLSHASDFLAQAILEEIEPLAITPIASHSNFRAAHPHRRNLPDDIAQEIAKRNGVIGLNVVRHFLGSNGPQDLIAHIRHAEELGIADHLCLGADFFGEIDVDPKRAHLKPYFFEGFSTSACYPKLRTLLLTAFSKEFVDHFMYKRLINFLDSQ